MSSQRSILVVLGLLWLLVQPTLAQGIPGLTSRRKKEIPPERRWAVLVGISEYGNLPKSSWLLNCDADAQAIADFLQSPRGGSLPEQNLKLLLNQEATTKKIRLALDFLITNAGPGDVVYFFYAGHGKVKQFGSGEAAYLMPYDSEPEHLNATALPMDEIHRYVDVHLRQVSQVVMITDACHAGALIPIQQSDGRKTHSIAEHLQEIGERDGVLNLMACRRDEVAIEDSRLGGHGVLTYALLRALNGAANSTRKGVVRTQDVLEYITRQVPRLTNQKQHPRHSSNYVDEFPMAFLNREGPDLNLPDTPGSVLERSPTESVFGRNKARATLRVVGAKRKTELYLVRGSEQRTVGRVLSESNVLVTEGLEPGTYTLVQASGEEQKEWEISLDNGTSSFDVRTGKFR